MPATSKLPTWNLKDLYHSPEDDKLFEDLDKSLVHAQKFEKKYRGKLGALAKSPDKFAALLKAYSDIYTLSASPVIYASLRFAETSADQSRGALLQHMRTEHTAIARHLVFFDLEILTVPQATMKKLLAAKAIAPYKNFLTLVLDGKKHRLSENEEKLMADKALTGRSAFSRLFDEEMGAATYTVKVSGRSKELSQTEVLNLLHHTKRGNRKEAARSLSEGLKSQSRRLSFIYNTLVEDKAVNDRYRKYEASEDARHRDNQITRDMVDALCLSVQESYRLVQDFYRFKKQVLGLKKLYDYDRYAPIASSEKKIPYQKARDMILEAFSTFSPEFSDVAALFFKKNWIDARERKGKRGGAFCQMGTPIVHPYVFINYSGSMRDVFTLAHELGHGIHGYLMKDQNYLNFDVPLTVCETASVFSEMLLFDYLKTHEASQKELFALSMHKIESIFATVYRQISMFLFERDVHASRKHGELAPEDFGEIWMHHQKEMFQSSISFEDGYKWWWAYIPHFIHSPFYVYAYAFGELLTLSLFKQYQEKPVGFPEKFMSLLASGGSKSPSELVRPFKVNMKSVDFWRGGVSVIADMVKDVKRLKKSL